MEMRKRKSDLVDINGGTRSDSDGDQHVAKSLKNDPESVIIEDGTSLIDTVVSKHALGEICPIISKSTSSPLRVGEEYTKCWELLEALLFFGYFPALGSLLKDIPVATFCESFRDKPDEVIEYF